MSIPCNHGHFSRYNPTPPASRMEKVTGWCILPFAIVAMMAWEILRPRRTK